MKRWVLLLGLAASWGLSGCTDQTASTSPPAEVPEGMVYIPGGTFEMGTNRGFPFEGPVHQVTVRPFYIDRHEVTNAQFAEFVRATGYRTVAEKEGWSGVFDRRDGKWKPVTGADWRHPEGLGSSIEGRDDYPVVQVAWFDAVEYAKWAGKRLPTEAEWEFAARGGEKGRTYFWGQELVPDGKYMANFWQGTFPEKDLGEDGYAGIAPVGKFPANGYGLHDMAANVWEWVNDRFGATYYAQSAAVDPQGPSEGEERVIRGGSFLCAENFCRGYRVAARNKTTPDSGANHQGFRCAQDVP